MLKVPAAQRQLCSFWINALDFFLLVFVLRVRTSKHLWIYTNRASSATLSVLRKLGPAKMCKAGTSGITWRHKFSRTLMFLSHAYAPHTRAFVIPGMPVFTPIPAHPLCPSLGGFITPAIFAQHRLFIHRPCSYRAASWNAISIFICRQK